jgi:F0F1-type ATP synthase assembly protein I
MVGCGILCRRTKPEAGVERGPNPDQQDLRVIGVATGLGCSIVAALVLCIGGGVFLDRQFGTTPVLTLIGVALGLVVAGYQLWELAKVGNPKAQAGPVTRQIARLPVARAGVRQAQERENERNEE